MGPHVEYAFVTHFDSANGMVYAPKPKREKRTVANPTWWIERIKIIRQYVLPSLKNQNDQDFTAWALFDRYRHDLNAFDTWCTSGDRFISTVNGPQSLRIRYKDHCDYLVLIHLDSDDMYGCGALEAIKQVKPSPGLIMFFERGFFYGLDDKRLFTCATKKGRVGPPPHFANVYTKESLQSKQAWDAYRAQHKFNLLHFQLYRAPHQVILPPGHFCGSVHGANTTRQWDHPTMSKRLGKEIKDQVKKEIVLATFGQATSQA